MKIGGVGIYSVKLESGPGPIFGPPGDRGADPLPEVVHRGGVTL